MERCWCRGRSGAQRSAAQHAQRGISCTSHTACLACMWGVLPSGLQAGCVCGSWLLWHPFSLGCIASLAFSTTCICRELLGKHLHFEVLQGASAIEEAAADEQPAAAAGSTAAAAGSSAAAGAAASSSKRPPPPAAAKWVRQRPAVLLPWGTGMPQMPVQLRLDGELMQFRWAG